MKSHIFFTACVSGSDNLYRFCMYLFGVTIYWIFFCLLLLIFMLFLFQIKKLLNYNYKRTGKMFFFKKEVKSYLRNMYYITRKVKNFNENLSRNVVTIKKGEWVLVSNNIFNKAIFLITL